MIENEINYLVYARLKELIQKDKIIFYREHEIFYSKKKKPYEFLIIKTQPRDLEAFNLEIQRLIEKEGYQFLKGYSSHPPLPAGTCASIPDPLMYSFDITNYNPEKQTGYKVMALYKP